MLFALAEVLARAEAPVRVQLVLPYWPERPQLAEEPLAPLLRAIEERARSSRRSRAGPVAPAVYVAATRARDRVIFSGRTAEQTRKTLLDATRTIAQGRAQSHFAKIEVSGCRAIGCGFLRRCHGEERST